MCETFRRSELTEFNRSMDREYKGMFENLTLTKFITGLWNMVNDPDTDHIIEWSKSGSTFVIRDSHKLFVNVLPEYYKHSSITTFYSQLKNYDFGKVYSSDIEYYHRYFQRDEPDLLSGIKRRVPVAKKTTQEGDDN
ncbi:hypothetical protein Trydic_g11812 [Trypoxylus dichotomus]